MQIKKHTVIILASLLLAPSSLCGTDAAEITLSADVAGKTPDVIGYNAAHFMPGSNTVTWWQYAQVNGARIWATPGAVEPEDDNGLWGDGVTDEATFLSRRAALHSNPLNVDHINWPVFEHNYQHAQTSGNIQILDFALEQLKANGISVLATINRSASQYPFSQAGTPAGYGDRWEHWQHYYAQAFYMARYHDVQRYQVYNEPDHSSNSNLSQAEYLERLQLASDAIHCAISDVNQLFGKSLIAQVQAPVNSGGNKVYARPGGDPRDDLTGWGELVINNRNTDLFGDHDNASEIFQTYAYHFYNLTGPTAGSTLASVIQILDQASSDQTIPVAITEFNTHTAATFAGLDETLDSPSEFASFGSILSNLINNKPQELYVFKFGQTEVTPDSVKKNGTHYVDNNDEPYNTGGATKSAGVLRLAAKGFKGSKKLLAEPSATGIGVKHLSMTASYDEANHHYFLMSTNTSNELTTTMNIDLTSLDIHPGSVISIEEVSDHLHGEVVQLVTVPDSKTITLEQSPESVWLLTIPGGPVQEQVILDAVEDAMVKAGVNADTNYGTSQNLIAKNDPANPNARNVSFIKFDLGAVDTAKVDRAVLRFSGKDALSENGVITHVYGIMDDTWSEDAITWSTAPNLAESNGLVDGIEDNFVEGIGDSAVFVGHLTSTAEQSIMQLDITEFVRDHGDRLVSLLITREVRWDGENVDDALGSLYMASKERSDGFGPQLLVFIDASSVTLRGDLNNDGYVGLDDLDIILNNWNQSGPLIDDRADVSGTDGIPDGYIGLDDLDVVLGNWNAFTPPTGVDIPEPTTSAYLILGAFFHTLRGIDLNRSIESARCCDLTPRQG